MVAELRVSDSTDPDQTRLALGLLGQITDKKNHRELKINLISLSFKTTRQALTLSLDLLNADRLVREGSGGGQDLGREAGKNC